MSKSTRSRAARSSGRGRTLVGRGGRHGTAADAVETFTRPNKTIPVVILLILWRWRWEIAVVIATVVAWFRLHPDGLNDAATVAVMVGPFAVMMAFGPTRRYWRNRFWCVVTRHRVRACLTEMRTLNYSGNLPFIVFCRSTKVGESVWLFMRPGLSELDLENKAENLAAAGWAREARIERSRRNAAVIRIDIDRRDPLAKAHITSPLVGDTAGLPDGEIVHGAVLDVIRPNPGTEPVPATATKQPANASGDTYVSTREDMQPGAGSDIAVHETTRKVKKPKTIVHADTAQAAQAAQAAPVVLLNGEDVSDYV